MDIFELAKASFLEGLEQLQLENWPEAAAAFQESLRLLPCRLSTLNNLAAVQLKLEQLDNAEATIALLFSIDPVTPEAWINRGLLYKARGEPNSALECFDQAVTVNPEDADAWLNRGVILHELGRDEDALFSYQRAIDIQPAHLEAWTNKGVSYDALDSPEAALACHQRALSIKPEHFQAWSNQGSALKNLNRLPEALASYERAIELRPENAQAHNNLALALAEMGCYPAALASYNYAIELAPGYADAHWNRGLLNLEQEYYDAGWEDFEYRWQVSGLDLKRISSTAPRWAYAKSTKSLLLWGEQGIGDQILYASILPDLADFPQRKLVALDQRLIPLFARAMPGFEFIDLTQVSDALGFVEQLPLGSLPHNFRRSRESFATTRHSFLAADPARTATLRRKIARPNKRVIGVSWLSSRKNIGPHKSITLAQMLAPLASEKLHFVDLQYGDTKTERDALQEEHGITVQHLDEVDNFNDIDGLAALIQACDVVITTSNSTAHLAGALGKETLLLLPSGKGKLWYWVEYEGRNPWYPSIRIFAQAQPGQWQQPLAQLKAHLENKPWN